MTNYGNGSYFERRVLGILEHDGYTVVRSAGSHGVADVIGLKAFEIVLVQCKAGAGTCPLPEWNRLYAVADSLRGSMDVAVVPVLATRTVGGRVVWTELLGTVAPRQARPGRPWHPDRVTGNVAP